MEAPLPTPTVRTKAELLEIGDDPGEEYGTYDLLRDAIETLYARPQGRGRALTEFNDGAGFGETASRAAANTLAWEAGVASGESIYVDPDPDAVGFYFDALTPPIRSVFGQSSGRSKLNTAVGFTPRHNTFFETNELNAGSTVDSVGILDDNGQCDYVVGTDTETEAVATSKLSFRQCFFRGAGGEYVVAFLADPAFLSNPGVGSEFKECSISASSGMGWIRGENAVDDTVFDHCRFTMGGGDMRNIPIHLADTQFNWAFLSPFVAWQKDYDGSNSNNAIVRVDDGSRPLRWSGGFIEPPHITHTQLKHIFYIDSGTASITDAVVEAGSTFPAGSSFARVTATGASSPRVKVHSVSVDAINMNAIVGLYTGASGSGVAHVDVRQCSGNTITDAVNSGNGTTTSGAISANFKGEFEGQSFDHDIEHDGTNLILTPTGTVSITNSDSPYTVTTETLVLADASSGAITVNLPAANNGVVVTVKKTDSSVNAVTLDGNGSETIDGAATQVLSSQYDFMTVSPASGAYHIVAN